VKKKVVIY